MPEIIRTISHAHWLELRAADITSTESPALFGLSPYTSEFELYHRKKDKDPHVIEDNDRMKWGRRLEDVIAQGVAEDMGIKVRRLKTYMRHDTCEGMGASFDYEIVSHDDGPGIMEIKNVDGMIFRQQWQEDEAPDHIEVQIQHQMEVANRNWGLIVALVGGNEPVIIRRERDREVGAALVDAIDYFWKKITIGIAPEPDFARDAAFISQLYSSAGQEVLDARGDESINLLLSEYHYLTNEKKKYSDLKDAKKAEILMKIESHYNKVLADDGISLSCGVTKDTAPTLITDDMIGQEIGGKSGHRMFRIYKKAVINLDEPLPQLF